MTFCFALFKFARVILVAGSDHSRTVKKSGSAGLIALWLDKNLRKADVNYEHTQILSPTHCNFEHMAVQPWK